MNARPSPDTRQLPAGPPVIPHRKNAAEWVMWVALRPAVVVVRWVGQLRGRPGG